jgi:nicotinamidase/pyrazinamidase
LTPADLILRKGVNPVVNGHWAFRENDKTTMTGLAGYLSERDVERIFLCGLPLDFCVGHSAIDAVINNFQAVVVEDACRAIDLDGSLQAMMDAFSHHKIPLIDSMDLTN